FVKKLADSLQLGSGIKLALAPTELVASWGFRLPDLVGPLTISNINVRTGIVLPFLGGPTTVQVEVGDKMAPCLVAIGIMAGAASFRIRVAASPQPIEEIACSLEGGAFLGLSLGPISGRVLASFGIYFVQGRDGAHAQAFFRVFGEVSVLGILRV